MDLRLYYHKVRTVEATIPGEYAIVVSLETPDGGREGQYSEVSRSTAASLVVQGKARLANAKEAEQFKESVRATKKAADEQAFKELFPRGFDVELLRSALREEE